MGFNISFEQGLQIADEFVQALEPAAAANAGQSLHATATAVAESAAPTLVSVAQSVVGSVIDKNITDPAENGLAKTSTLLALSFALRQIFGASAGSAIFGASEGGSSSPTQVPTP